MAFLSFTSNAFADYRVNNDGVSVYNSSTGQYDNITSSKPNIYDSNKKHFVGQFSDGTWEHNTDSVKWEKITGSSASDLIVKRNRLEGNYSGKWWGFDFRTRSWKEISAVSPPPPIDPIPNESQEVKRLKKKIKSLEIDLNDKKDLLHEVKGEIAQTDKKIKNWDRTVQNADRRLPKVRIEIKNTELKISNLKEKESDLINKLNKVSANLNRIPRACLTANSYKFGTETEVTNAVRNSAYGSQLGNDPDVNIAYEDAEMSKVCELVGFRTVAYSKKHRVSGCRNNPIAIYLPNQDKFVVKPPCELRTFIKRLTCEDRFTPITGCSSRQLDQLETLQERKKGLEKSLQNVRSQINSSKSLLNSKIKEEKELKRTIQSSSTELTRLEYKSEDLLREERLTLDEIQEIKNKLMAARKKLRRLTGRDSNF